MNEKGGGIGIKHHSPHVIRSGKAGGASQPTGEVQCKTRQTGGRIGLANPIVDSLTATVIESRKEKRHWAPIRGQMRYHYARPIKEQLIPVKRKPGPKYGLGGNYHTIAI